MWKGKHKALHRSCEQLEQELRLLKQSKTTTATIAPLSTMTPNGPENTQAELYSASLARSTSFGGKGFPSAAATVPLRPRVSSDDSLKDDVHDSSKRNSGPDAHKASSPAIQRSGSVNAWSSAVRGEAGGASADGGGGGPDPRRLLEYAVHYGVAASTAEAMWLDDSEDDETKTVFCIPEQLSCFPCAPPVEELEQFCFPEMVGVQLLPEHEATSWFKHWQGGPLDPGLGSAGRAGKDPGSAESVLHSVGADAAGAAGAAGEDVLGQEEQDQFIFVLSTQQDGGQPLYGIALYFDEPSPVRTPAPKPPVTGPLPAEGQAGEAAAPGPGDSRVVFVRSRRCFCLLSRVPLFDSHVRVLRMLVADRARTIAGHAKRVARAGGAGGGEAAEQWPGSDFGPGALGILEDYLRAPVLGPEACRPGPDGRPGFTVHLRGEPLVVAWSGGDERDEAEAAATKFGMRFLFGYDGWCSLSHPSRVRRLVRGRTRVGYDGWCAAVPE
jgi:hypothetical protein